MSDESIKQRRKRQAENEARKIINFKGEPALSQPYPE